MSRIGAVVVVCHLVGVLSATRTAGAVPPGPENFGHRPVIEHVAISPLGQTLAWHETTAAGSAIVMFEVARRRERPVALIEPTLRVRRIVWASDRDLLYAVAPPWLDESAELADAQDTMRIFTVDLRQRSPHTMLPRDEANGLFRTRLLSLRTDDPHAVIMSSRVFRAAHARDRDAEGDSVIGVSTLFRVNTHSGHGVIAEEGTRHTREWVVDAVGRAVARSEWDADARTFAILARDGRSWRSAYSRTDGRTLRLGGLRPDARHLIAFGPDEHPAAHSRAWSIPLDGGDAVPMATTPDEDVIGVVTDPWNDAVVGLRVGGLVPSVRWLDPAWRSRAETLMRKFAGAEARIESRSSDGTQFIVAVGDPSHPVTYQYVDLHTGVAQLVGASYPDLEDTELGDVRPWIYRARDGLPIPAYLTLPPGRAERNLPLVVLIHDGPAGRDEYTFDWWAQFLASRGYVVLQPQYRGSAGFGEDFERAGHGEWGGRMQDDVTDGVTALVDQGIADRRCVCAMGSGYGAFAALLEAARKPDLYACAVGVNGIYDLRAHLGLLRTDYGADSSELQYWRSQWGTDAIRAAPFNFAGDVRAAVLLAHVADDPVFPASQSLDMQRALTEAGVQAALVKLGGEDHRLAQSWTRIRVLTEIESLLREQMQPRCNEVR